MGIERNGKDGHEDHVDAVFHRGTHEVFADFKVSVRPRRDVIVVRKAVRIEPVGNAGVLCRQQRIHDGDLHKGSLQHGIAAHNRDFGRIHAWLQVVAFKIDVGGVQLLIDKRYTAAVHRMGKHIGIQPRFGT